MKKLHKFIFILILSLIPNVVFAEEDEQNHMFMIEKFQISGTSINMEGYSYMSHRDNYGIGLDSYGNLKTYIIAYTGNWNNEYANYNNCTSTGIHKNKCYTIKTTTKARDFWAARCMDKSCDDENYVLKTRLREGFLNTTACTSGGSDKVNYLGGAHCLYYNVGFSTTINLQSIASRFGNGADEYLGDIKFKIIPYISDKAQCANGEYIGNNQCQHKLSGGRTTNVPATFSDLTLYEGYCKVGNKKCEKTVTSGDYTFNISGLSNQVYFDASMVIPRDQNYNQLKGGTIGGYFKASTPNDINSLYTVLDITEKKDLVKKENTTGYIGYYSSPLLRLRTIRRPGNCGDYNGGVSYDGCIYPASENGVTNYYTASTYLIFKGSLVINGFRPNTIEMNCSDINGFSTNSKTENTVNCGNTGKYNQCKKTENVQTTIYLKSNNSCSYFKSKKNNNYYIPITVTTDILINQEGIFSFGKITHADPILIKGRGFKLGQTTYKNNITWLIANRTASGQPYYKYNGTDWIVSGDSCVANPNFAISDEKEYYIPTDSGGISEESYNLKTASYLAIEKAVTNNKNLIDTSVVNDINFKSCDSNDSKGCNINNATKVIDNGNWKNTLTKNYSVNLSFNNKKGTMSVGVGDISTRFGRQITNEYSYTLPYSYVTTEENGKVLYFDKEQNLDDLDYVDGKHKYFVDMKYEYDNPNGNDFPFNLNNSNPSFVSSMDWSLKGTCGVEVKDGYFCIENCDEKRKGSLLINYRPISLSEPFPKADATYSNIAINWREWYKTRDNQLRIKNTYNNNSLYEIIISYNGRAGTTKISDINAIDKFYTDISGIDVDGQSDFVNKYFSKRAIAKESFCGLGKISPNCDGVRGG